MAMMLLPSPANEPGIARVYARACRWRGPAELFADPHERLSGHAAWEASRRFAAALPALGWQPGGVVAFLCKSSARHACAWFGVTLAGGVACSLHVRETAPKLAEALDWLGASVLVHDADLAPLAAEVLSAAGMDSGLKACRRVSLGAKGDAEAAWDAIQADRTGLPSADFPPADALAGIILSSGSTGRPKGVMHTQRTLAANARAGQQLYSQVTAQDTVLVMMQPSFAAWVNVVLPCVGGGARVVFGGVFTPAGFLEQLAAERVSLAPLVPTMWRMVLAEDVARHDLSAMRNVSISGEPPARPDLQGIHDRVCRNISSFYCSSEAGTGAAVLATTHDILDRDKPATSGKPVVGADLKVIDPAGGFDDELPPGETGEIAVAGSSLALGYWRDEALTRERYRDGWWRSGDLGRLDEDGDLFVEGRTDNLINTGGVKVHGEEVERVLLAHPGVAQVAVVGARDARWGERIEAHLVPRAGSWGEAPSVEALDAHCRAQGLAGFKVPKAFHFVAALPVGPTGKVYRRGLRGQG